MKMIETGRYRLIKEDFGIGPYWAIYFIYHGFKDRSYSSKGRSYCFMTYRETLTEALAYCREVKI